MTNRFATSFLLTVAAIGLAAAPSFAQTNDAPSNPDTRQTDQSEEDWRNSKKKRNTSDIFEDILNGRNDGSGTDYGPVDPMDTLPEESRRHLMKERAKVLARTDVGKAPTASQAPYVPSDAAEDDPSLAAQEKEAWESVVKDMQDDANGTSSDGSNQGGQGQPSGSQQGSQPGQAGQSGQSGGQGQQGQNSGQRAPSTMRGGSSASVADILAQIKGLKSGGTTSGQSPAGTSPTGQTQTGQNSGGQSPNGQSPTGQTTNGQPANGQASGGAPQDGQSSQQGSQSQDGNAQSSQQNSSDAQNAAQDNAQSGQQSASEQSSAQQSANNQNSQANPAADDAQDASASDSATQPPIGPLDRLKNQQRETDPGRKTSASDFLKKKSD